MITSPAQRQLRRMPVPGREHIALTFEHMSDDPFGGDVKYLRGRDGILRRRVGSWRVLYTLDAKRKLIILVGVKRRGSHSY